MNILMLGWELPPAISGGLGVACDGLLRGISTFEDIATTFVLPDRSVPVPGDYAETVSIVGLGDLPTIPTASPISGPENAETVPLLRPPGSYSRGAFGEAMAYAERLIGTSRQLGHFDLIHAHDWLTFEAAIRLKKATGRKLLVHVHSTELDRSRRTGKDDLIRVIEQRGLDAADRVITVSNYTRDTVIHAYRQEPHRVATVYNACPNQAPEDRNVASSSSRLVTFLGRVTYQKGPEHFLEAAFEIWKKSPDVRFVMAGDGDLLPLMKSLAASLGMADVIAFPGFLSPAQRRHLLSQSSVFVMPSRSEPFGLAALEAVMAGVPVVVSNRCGMTERIGSVIRVEPGDVDAIVEACIKILNEPDFSRTLSEKALFDARYLTWEASARDVRKIYLDLLA